MIVSANNIVSVSLYVQIYTAVSLYEMCDYDIMTDTTTVRKQN